MSNTAPKKPKAAREVFQGLRSIRVDVLGITKTEYLRRLIDRSVEGAVQKGALEEKIDYVLARLAGELQRTEQSERYAPRIPGIVTAREALRRAKYFSEDCLNKEFDILLDFGQ